MNDDIQIMMIDCSVAGISGDMFISSLIDAGVSQKKVKSAMESSATKLRGCKDAKISFNTVMRGCFKAKTLTSKFEDRSHSRRGVEIIQAVSDSANDLKLSKPAKNFAAKVVETLVNVESKIHDESKSKLHMHEIGSPDTVADSIGSAVALDLLDAFDNFRIFVSPISVGGGILKFSHGLISNPGPAALEILTSKKLIIQGGPIPAELVTPTGASILVALDAKPVNFFPKMVPIITGVGAGSRQSKEVPNILRVTLGKVLSDRVTDSITILETNLDDVSGEILAFTAEKMLLEGALDTYTTPIIGKKGRPSWILSVICRPIDVERLSSIIMLETGTLGVRVQHCDRLTALRDQITLTFQSGRKTHKLRGKKSYLQNGKFVNLKPEYDDLKQIAKDTNIPVRFIHNEVVKPVFSSAAKKGKKRRKINKNGVRASKSKV